MEGDDTADRSVLAASVRRIRESPVLRVCAAVTLLDYAGYLTLGVLGRFSWEYGLLLFLFSAASWYFTVSWTPFWNEIMKGRRGELGRRFAEFVENFCLLALVLVHGLYTAILVVTLVRL